MYNDIRPKKEISTGESLSRLFSRGSSEISGSLSQIVDKGMKMLLEKGLGKELEYEADVLTPIVGERGFTGVREVVIAVVNLAAARQVESADDVQQGRLAAARRP